ncbi:hypothetical protein EF405_20030 [Cyclobacteriaceae bacterium YHN15]|nr:hypothetical protein EF405_20030 [Cyclobacteriaceae bacterium YHN15]
MGPSLSAVADQRLEPFWIGDLPDAGELEPVRVFNLRIKNPIYHGSGLQIPISSLNSLGPASGEAGQRTKANNHYNN